MGDKLREAEVEARDPVFAALVDDIGNLIDAKLDQHQISQGKRPQYLLICLDADMLETVAEISDHDRLFDAMTEISAEWVEEGLVEIDDSEEPPAPRIQ